MDSWSGSRFAARPIEIVRFRKGQSSDVDGFTVSAGLHLNDEKVVYSAKVGFNPDDPDGFRWLSDGTSVDGQPVAGAVDLGSRWRSISESPRPYLTRNLDDESPHDDLRLRLRTALGNMRFLDPSPTRMREPSIPGATTLGDYGQNLPTVLEAICVDADRKQTLLSWFEELTPMDVQGFEFPRDPSGRVHLLHHWSATGARCRLTALPTARCGSWGYWPRC